MSFYIGKLQMLIILKFLTNRSYCNIIKLLIYMSIFFITNFTNKNKSKLNEISYSISVVLFISFNEILFKIVF